MYCDQAQCLALIDASLTQLPEEAADRYLAIGRVQLYVGMLAVNAAARKNAQQYLELTRAFRQVGYLLSAGVDSMRVTDCACVARAIGEALPRHADSAAPTAGIQLGAFDARASHAGIAEILNDIERQSGFARRCGLLVVGLNFATIAMASAWRDENLLALTCCQAMQLCLVAARDEQLGSEPDTGAAARELVSAFFARLSDAVRPEITIVNQIPAPEVSVRFPARRTETEVRRDAAGNLLGATQVETDV